MGDVAIYPSVLPASSVLTHFETAYGTNASFGSVYTNAVLADNPSLYYRLNDGPGQTNGGYPISTFPIATNYGTLGASANGAYQPGTSPGATGPSYAGFGSESKAVAINGWLGAVDVGASNLPPALNPTNTSPLTLVTWFQGNPADSPQRFQEMVGHGDSSYRLSLGQAAADVHFNPGPGPELQFANPGDLISNGFAVNDGRWHMAAGVTDGANEYLYIDGLLAKSSNNAAGIKITGNPADLLLGGDSEYTYASAGAANTIRNFDGQVAHVAFWTNALSQAQIQSLFNAAGIPPTIYTEPIGATNNQGTPLTIGATLRGSAPFTYQWWNTNGTRVAGQTNLQLAFNAVTTNQIGSYYLVATSPYGSVTSSVVQVYVYGPPAVISQTQTNLQIFAGQSPVLTLSTSGAQPISYQWYSNNVLIPSATGSTYKVTNIQTSATFTSVISNSVGVITNQAVRVTVLPTPTAPYPAKVLADHPVAFWRLDETSGTSAYDYVSGYNGTYTNVVLATYAGGSSYDPIADPAEAAPAFGQPAGFTNDSFVGWIPTNLNFATPTNANAEFSIECWVMGVLPPPATPNGSLVAQESYGNGGEEYVLDMGAASTPGPIRFFVRQTDGQADAANSTFIPDDSTWHHFVAVCDEANSRLSIYVDGTSAAVGTVPAKSGILDAIGSITIGSRQEGLGTQWDDQFSGGLSQVAIYNYALSADQVQAHYLASGIAPGVTVNPPTETVDAGGTATFTAVATGTEPVSYQWLNPNNQPISTNAVLTLTDVQEAAGGTYSVVVSNTYGSATGSATLTVAEGPPQITQDITTLNQTVPLYAGLDEITYSVTASGSAPLSYQWYENGVAVPHATNASYTFTAPAGTNTYYVTVTNAYTATQAGGAPATSSTATLIGIAVPQVIPTNYAHSVKITFPGYTGMPLTNFPALITLSISTVPSLDFSQFATKGSDLVFADASGTAVLPFEIDEWNVGGVSTIWVDIPVLNGTNIWAYWGNPGPALALPASSNVWLNAGYEIVYHLKETNFPYADSTGQYPATNGVAPIQTPGVVGHGQAFNGSSDFLTPGTVTLSNTFTTYAWVNLDPSATDIKTIWANQAGGYGANGFAEFVDAYQTADRGILVASGNGNGGGSQLEFSTFPSADWHFFVVTFDQPNTHFNAYLDGALVGSGGIVGDFALTNQLNLGAFLNPTFYWIGDMDEARIQAGVASTNWITTTYLNISQSSFVSFSVPGQQQSPQLSVSYSTNNLTFTWPSSDGNFVLESTTNLSRPVEWTQVTSPAPTLSNGAWSQTIPADHSGSYFYRLQSQ